MDGVLDKLETDELRAKIVLKFAGKRGISEDNIVRVVSYLLSNNRFSDVKTIIGEVGLSERVNQVFESYIRCITDDGDCVRSAAQAELARNNPDGARIHYIKAGMHEEAAEITDDPKEAENLCQTIINQHLAEDNYMKAVDTAVKAGMQEKAQELRLEGIEFYLKGASEGRSDGYYKVYAGQLAEAAGLFDKAVEIFLEFWPSEAAGVHIR